MNKIVSRPRRRKKRL